MTDTAIIEVTADHPRPCPECPRNDAREIGPLDERCPRCAALGEWSFFCDFHQHLRDFDLDDARLTFTATGAFTQEARSYVDGEMERVYNAAHLRIFRSPGSDACQIGGNHSACTAGVTTYRIPSETYAAQKLARVSASPRGAGFIPASIDDVPSLRIATWVTPHDLQDLSSPRHDPCLARALPHLRLGIRCSQRHRRAIRATPAPGVDTARASAPSVQSANTARCVRQPKSITSTTAPSAATCSPAMMVRWRCVMDAMPARQAARTPARGSPRGRRLYTPRFQAGHPLCATSHAPNRPGGSASDRPGSSAWPRIA